MGQDVAARWTRGSKATVDGKSEVRVEQPQPRALPERTLEVRLCGALFTDLTRLLDPAHPQQKGTIIISGDE